MWKAHTSEKTFLDRQQWSITIMFLFVLPLVLPFALGSTEMPSVSPTQNPTELQNFSRCDVADDPSYCSSLGSLRLPGDCCLTAIPGSYPLTLCHECCGNTCWSTGSMQPTNAPTRIPTVSPTQSPTHSPTSLPSSSAPTTVPSTAPTPQPSLHPTISPTSGLPTLSPTFGPSSIPSDSPTPCPPDLFSQCSSLTTDFCCERGTSWLVCQRTCCSVYCPTLAPSLEPYDAVCMDVLEYFPQDDDDRELMNPELGFIKFGIESYAFSHSSLARDEVVRMDYVQVGRNISLTLAIVTSSDLDLVVTQLDTAIQAEHMVQVFNFTSSELLEYVAANPRVCQASKTEAPTLSPTPCASIDSPSAQCDLHDLPRECCGNALLMSSCTICCDHACEGDSYQPTVLPTAAPSTSYPTQTPTTRQPTLSPSSSPTPCASPDVENTAPTFICDSITARDCLNDSSVFAQACQLSCCAFTASPTSNPTAHPSTSDPTQNPSSAPLSSTPTVSPSGEPTLSPTSTPSSSSPSATPTHAPATSSPTSAPTESNPTFIPSAIPSEVVPTLLPTDAPSTPYPSKIPSVVPSSSPTSPDPTSLVPTQVPTTSVPTTGTLQRVLLVDVLYNGTENLELVSHYVAPILRSFIVNQTTIEDFQFTHPSMYFSNIDGTSFAAGFVYEILSDQRSRGRIRRATEESAEIRFTIPMKQLLAGGPTLAEVIQAADLLDGKQIDAFVPQNEFCPLVSSVETGCDVRSLQRHSRSCPCEDYYDIEAAFSNPVHNCEAEIRENGILESSLLGAGINREVCDICARSCCFALFPSTAPSSTPSQAPISPTSAPETSVPSTSPTSSTPTGAPSPRQITSVPSSVPSNTPTFAPTVAPTVEICEHDIDIVFVLDESRSVDVVSFEHMKQFVMDFLDFYIWEDSGSIRKGTRVGLVTFSGEGEYPGSAKTHFQLGQTDIYGSPWSREYTKQYINEVLHTGGSVRSGTTHTDKGLEHAICLLNHSFMSDDLSLVCNISDTCGYKSAYNLGICAGEDHSVVVPSDDGLSAFQYPRDLPFETSTVSNDLHGPRSAEFQIWRNVVVLTDGLPDSGGTIDRIALTERNTRILRNNLDAEVHLVVVGNGDTTRDSTIFTELQRIFDIGDGRAVSSAYAHLFTNYSEISQKAARDIATALCPECAKDRFSDCANRVEFSRFGCLDPEATFCNTTCCSFVSPTISPTFLPTYNPGYQPPTQIPTSFPSFSPSVFIPPTPPTMEPTRAPSKPFCPYAIDLVFLVDVSTSNEQMEMIRRLVIEISSNDEFFLNDRFDAEGHVGVAGFSYPNSDPQLYYPRIEVSLAAHDDILSASDRRNILRTSINNIPQFGGLTFIWPALDMIRPSSPGNPTGWRPVSAGARRVVVLITDGQFTDFRNPFSERRFYGSYGGYPGYMTRSTDLWASQLRWPPCSGCASIQNGSHCTGATNSCIPLCDYKHSLLAEGIEVIGIPFSSMQQSGDLWSVYLQLVDRVADQNADSNWNVSALQHTICFPSSDESQSTCGTPTLMPTMGPIRHPTFSSPTLIPSLSPTLKPSRLPSTTSPSTSAPSFAPSPLPTSVTCSSVQDIGISRSDCLALAVRGDCVSSSAVNQICAATCSGCGKSRVNCSTLQALFGTAPRTGGWGYRNQPDGEQHICAASFINDQCWGTGGTHRVSMPDAIAICASIGARVCTRTELHDDIAKGTGCGLDTKLVWASDGSVIKGAGGGTRPHSVSRSKFGVRCCADRAGAENWGDSLVSKSPQPCAVLVRNHGFVYRKDPQRQTCATSFPTSCRGKLRFADAQNLCTSVGARLCTLDELENNFAKGTGCGLDTAKKIWTSSPCSVGLYYTTGGSSASGIEAECAESLNISRFVRCCGDAIGAAARSMKTTSVLDTNTTISSHRKAFSVVTTLGLMLTTMVLLLVATVARFFVLKHKSAYNN